MRYRIDDMPIRRKFIMLFLLGVLVPIALLLTYVLTSVTSSIREREALNASMSLERVYATLETQFSSVVGLSNVITADAQLTSLIDKRYESPSEYYSVFIQSLKPMMSRYIYAYSQVITGIWLYTDNHTMINGGQYLQINDGKALSGWYNEDDTHYNRLVSFIAHAPPRSDTKQISIVRRINTSSKFEHILRIDFSMNAIHNVIERERTFMQIYLVNPDGYAVSYPGSTVDSMVARLDVPPPENIDLRMNFSDDSAMDGWSLVSVINAAPMERSIRQAVWFGLLAGLVCTALAATLSVLFSRSISQRNHRLLKHMDSMNAESFEPIKRCMGKDEIGELMQHFNALGERLKQLVNDLYVLQIKQKSMELENVRAELKYLQAQIDPHFLFNTLNAILVLCVKNGYKDVSEIIGALSKILRRMVDTSRDTVTLREELEFVRMVLKIEQFRFGDKLTYSFDVDENTLERSVPMMSVQGLVENACKHGVQHMRENGVVRVEARLIDGALVISVSDNGVGITPKRLEEIKSGIASQQDMDGSIGLQNIYRRLNMHYGNDARLTLAQAGERGTVATITIPENGDEG